MPLITAFGQLIDGGHEYYFASETVPAVIDNHGWTDEVIGFAFWVMIYNFYNTIDTPVTNWRDMGLRDAVAGVEPEAVAARVAAEISPSVAEGTLQWDSMGVLRSALAKDATAWEVRFFEELERLVPGATERR